MLGDMNLKKDQILDWPLCQAQITNHLHRVMCSGAVLRQGKPEDPDLLCCLGQDAPSPERDANGWCEATSCPR